MKSHIKQLSFLLSFIFIIFALPVLSCIQGNEENNENRTLAPFPNIKNINLLDLPKEMELYLNDHIPFKSKITKAYSLTMINLFRTSPQKSVILGKDDFYFYHSIYKENNDSMADFSGRGKYSEEDMKRFANKLLRIKTHVESQGLDFFFMICPNKSSIYPELVPGYFKTVSEKHRADQVVAYLEENTDISVIYPRKSLIQSKDQYLLYYQKDTHWNDLGAYIGCQNLVLEILKMPPEPLDNLFIEEQKIHDKVENKILLLDLSNMLGLNGCVTDYLYNIKNYKSQITFTEETAKGVYSTSSTSPNDGLIFFGDSFSYSLRPYLAKNFSTVQYFTDISILNTDWSSQSASYFVYECVERNIDKVLEQN